MGQVVKDSGYLIHFDGRDTHETDPFRFDDAEGDRFTLVWFPHSTLIELDGDEQATVADMKFRRQPRMRQPSEAAGSALSVAPSPPPSDDRRLSGDRDHWLRRGSRWMRVHRRPRRLLAA